MKFEKFFRFEHRLIVISRKMNFLTYQTRSNSFFCISYSKNALRMDIEKSLAGTKEAFMT